jgi:hypothetical protein
MTGRLTLEECFEASERKLEVRVRADSEAEQKDAGDQSGNCNRALASYVLEIDSIGSDE